MQDLIGKIEELRKALTSFKPKSQQNSLVPALSIPSVKPLSMPSVKASAPAKLPGVTQPSGKDPKAMAAQLKNPRPKKPKIEIMKTDKNGQWSLEKAYTSAPQMPKGALKTIKGHQKEVHGHDMTNPADPEDSSNKP